MGQGNEWLVGILHVATYKTQPNSTPFRGGKSNEHIKRNGSTTSENEALPEEKCFLIPFSFVFAVSA